SHNDLIAVWFGIWSISYLKNNKKVLGGFFMLLSAGIKYITSPLLLLIIKDTPIFRKLSFGAVIGLIVYLSLKNESQPWYLLNLFIFIPWYSRFIKQMWPLFLGFLLSYYPFIYSDGWGNHANVLLKHQILLVVLVIQGVFLIGYYRRGLVK
ncbi:MAG: hypothetical protein ACMG6E_04070, partial [Candidatus Roizmanbacteria bacterium]